MATTPTPEEAVERARRVQEQRIETVRALAQTRQALSSEREAADRERAELEARLKERIRDHEAADVKAFNAAISAGWAPDELRRIGFPEPEKKRRARRRTTDRSKQQQTTPDDSDGSTVEAAAETAMQQPNGPNQNV